MTPIERTSLDDALARAGTDIVIRRTTGLPPFQTNTDVACRAIVRSWSSQGPQPQAMDGMTAQSDRLVIMSPTQFYAQFGEDDAKLPKRGDKMIEAGKTSNIEAAGFIRMSNEIVRIERQVRG